MSLNKYEQLDLAIQIATKAHKGQYDKSGKPYILHPLHLMNHLLFDIQLATIAVLHDTVEDCEWVTFKFLRDKGMSPRVVLGVMLLTHREGMPYADYINGICSNYDAIRVKRKDLSHNSDITRLKGVREKDIKRMVKYHKAFIQLSHAKKLFLR